MLRFSKPLIIFEMANNHMGDLEHGLRIVDALAEVAKGFDFQFALKLQYRHLETFIHPDYKDRMDLKFVKRFSETVLEEKEKLTLIKAIKDAGFLAMCTPFDETSVDHILEHGFDFLKVASCSVRDWPLLEKIGSAPLPVIVSTGGADISDVDKVVSFFEHKKKEFAIEHCVGIYPTEQSFTLNRIDWLKARYPDLEVGFSTHERADNMLPAAIAAAKGAMIFEKHIGVETDDYKLNEYSAGPEAVKRWLETIREALEMCGPTSLEEYQVSEQELNSLRDLKRGAFARKAISEGETFNQDDVFFAMPNSAGQMTAEDFSKHNLTMQAHHDVKAGDALDKFTISETDVRKTISSVIHQVKSQLRRARIFLGDDFDIDLSHHDGIDHFDKTGATIINCINRDYCKKLIVQTPGQDHPEHHHKRKEESFQVLWGSVFLSIDGKEREYFPGDIILIEPGQAHSFRTDKGVVFEEVSTTHYKDDSYYTEDIETTDSRKTKLKDWWLHI